MTRRQILASGAATVAATLGYTVGWEPRWLRFTSLACSIPGFRPARPLRLVHLSDLHACPTVPTELIEESVALAVAAKPDLICVTGDFVTSARGGFDRNWFRNLLSQLPRVAPTFGSMGNHDGGAWSANWGDDKTSDRTAALVGEAGILLLHNRDAAVEANGSVLTLTGLGDLWAKEFRPEEAFGPGRGPRILLSHNPDTKSRVADKPWDLMLSGHTHGGQVVLPAVGAPWAPVKDLRYLSGLKPWNGRQIHVSTGVGNAYGVRLNCRPEVNLIVIS